jgi:hypothetical protein
MLEAEYDSDMDNYSDDDGSAGNSAPSSPGSQSPSLGNRFARSSSPSLVGSSSAGITSKGSVNAGSTTKSTPENNSSMSRIFSRRSESNRLQSDSQDSRSPGIARTSSVARTSSIPRTGSSASEDDKFRSKRTVDKRMHKAGHHIAPPLTVRLYNVSCSDLI